MAISHTFSSLCIIRTSRAKDGKAPVYLRITVDGQRAEISVKESIPVDKWNSAKGRMKGNSEEAKSINKRLDNWETKVKEFHNTFIRDEKRINAQALKDAVLGVAEKDDDFLAYFDAHEKEVKSKIGIEYSAGTHKNYVSTRKHLEKFIPKYYRGQTLRLKDLDYDFLAKFETYLKLEAGNSINGSIKHIQRVKRVIHVAIMRGKLDRDPFANFQTKKEKTNREYLSQHELLLIENCQLERPVLRKVRDIFMFICYTGLSFSDLAELNEDEIAIGMDGDLWIRLDRNKTGTVVNIPILPPAKVILDKYSDHPEAKNKGTLLPVLSNQKMNKYLKEIATACNINKPVTCHIGRHTFATTVTLCNDIPVETVSQMLGHTSLRTTQIYAKVIEKKISKDMSKLKLLYGNQSSDQASNQ